MQVTAGFLTLAACALLAVVAPSLVVGWKLWHKGGASRVLAALGSVFVAAMAALSFAGTEQPRQVEEAILTSLLFWGVAFYALLGLSAGVFALKRLTGLTRRTSRRPSAAAELQR
jgi:hypothetical protein